MKSETNKLCGVGIDQGAPGGDQCAVVTILSRYGAVEVAAVDFLPIARRHAGKSGYMRWLGLWQRATYGKRLHMERVGLVNRMGPARPTAAKWRRLLKIRRYAHRALTGRG